MERFVIIGAGAAGIRAAQTLRKFRPEDLITVISIPAVCSINIWAMNGMPRASAL